MSLVFRRSPLPDRERAPYANWVRAGVLVSLVALPGPEANAYRFYGDALYFQSDLLLPPAADAVRWDESVWAAGETLTWVVAGDPGWTAPWTDGNGTTQPPPLESPDEVVPYVTEALAAWSAIGSADIRWEVSGVDSGMDHAERGDGRPTIFVDPEAERGAHAGVRWERIAGTWKTTDCDVPLAPFAAAQLDYNVWWTYVLIHEIGHCLGLYHAGAYPRIYANFAWDLRGAFGIDPLMSYGRYFGDSRTLALDDRVGASLLRPRPGWTAATGGIAGVVTDGSVPLPFIQVFALRVTDGSADGAVGTFTGEDGAFLLEGLEPGSYLLWAGPLNALSAHPGLLAHETAPALDAAEQAVMLPVDVMRGGTADGVQIVLGRTRAVATGVQ